MRKVELKYQHVPPSTHPFSLIHTYVLTSAVHSPNADIANHNSCKDNNIWITYTLYTTKSRTEEDTWHLCTPDSGYDFIVFFVM